mmetsp:Transcript_14287/g.34389  ORF Transcript_14287/g.34389 Transcript_14287/m.34389 type:complete len:284 (-) Transcript_14287:1143-1994(-)
MSRALPHTVPLKMCSTVRVSPLPGPSNTLTMLPTSTDSICASTALMLRVMSLRRMSCSRTARTSGRSGVLLCIISMAASFSTRTTMPTVPSSSMLRSCMLYSPMLSTRLVTSALSARSCMNTTNSSLVTSLNTVATSSSTLTTMPASPSCRPLMHRTWLPVLKYLRSCAMSMSSRSFSSRWDGFTVTVPSALMRSITPSRLRKSPSTTMTWSPGLNCRSGLWSPSEDARASRLASALEALAPPRPPSLWFIASVASSPAAYRCNSSSAGASAILQEARLMVLM